MNLPYGFFTKERMVMYMNKNILMALAGIIVLGGCVYGALLYSSPRNGSPTPTPNPQPSTSTDYTFTYLTSAQETTAFCDGANMDSDGYRAPLKDFIDGTEFDGRKPNAYIDQFAIGLKGNQKVEGGNVVGK